ncbi:MAG: type II toxin-antitoxin system RelE/ParE family toxin [Pseudolysinimonas sp.]|uniref:type II toxin-antitoxin system RelE family toxin n=1 Tax=Pseudolysinimonas sp. TaxID=2680009 RepID=UPI003C74973C
MSRYSVEFTTAAARQIRKLPPPIRARILTAAAALSDDPRPPGAKKLVGEQTAWRIRVGDYRVLDDIEDEILTITVVRAAHRREVYR